MKRQLNSRNFMHNEFPFFIHRIRHGVSNTPEMHGHDFVELVYVVNGEGWHQFEGNEYEIRAGDVFIINPGEVHTYRFEQGQQIEIINCLFQPSLIRDTLLRELEISQSMDYFYVHPFLNENERFNRRLNLQGSQAASALALFESMLLELNARMPGYSTLIRVKMVELLILLSRHYSFLQQPEASRRVGDSQVKVLRIKGYLERNYDQKIPLSQLADTFNISVRQLNRMIKQHTGFSVLDLLHQIRVERAKQLLVTTDDKVISVATAVGYEDPAFFSRLFARMVGCSPGKYRESIGYMVKY
ncbi:AraC family transcriptional regulator [Paenibacillus cremeus]|uniref:Helix-turn-helix domain-containing protein n=1 Tax=Paenibacillus cremeus TaxID=2163881 RepID=A0A559K7T4_9BACL|nr:AraC family transcriptional regulator [Paenibacillus cremeus]TVY08195.1 helix-turn-helix domain-containing protein [Paenibacillus cremeus]